MYRKNIFPFSVSYLFTYLSHLVVSDQQTHLILDKDKQLLQIIFSDDAGDEPEGQS